MSCMESNGSWCLLLTGIFYIVGVLNLLLPMATIVFCHPFSDNCCFREFFQSFKSLRQFQIISFWKYLFIKHESKISEKSAGWQSIYLNIIAVVQMASADEKFACLKTFSTFLKEQPLLFLPIGVFIGCNGYIHRNWLTQQKTTTQLDKLVSDA